MKRLIVRPSVVEKDLADLAESIAENNLSAALRFLDAAEKAFERLATCLKWVLSGRLIIRAWLASAFGQSEDSPNT